MVVGKFTLRTGYPHFLFRLGKAFCRTGLKSQQMETRTGLSRPTLTRIFGGDANPRLDTLDAVARALSTTVPDLLGPPAGERTDFDGEVDDPLLAPPPAMDWNARWVYEQLVARVDLDELRREISRLSYPFPNETPDQAIHRAVLDVFHTRQAWIAAKQLPRCKELERAIADRYSIPSCARVEDSVPGDRVLDPSATTRACQNRKSLLSRFVLSNPSSQIEPDPRSASRSILVPPASDVIAFNWLRRLKFCSPNAVRSIRSVPFTMSVITSSPA